MNIIRIEATLSTNNYLQEIAAISKLEEGTVVITRDQTAGRGQVGNSWESEPGKNLTFSTILYPHKLPVSNNFLLSQITSLAVKEALDEFTPGITIKWPNDIYFQDKKICGILIENAITGNELSQSIIGIGVNVNQEVFRSNAPNPVSLKQIIGKEIDLDTMLEKIMNRLFSWYQEILSGNTKKISTDYHYSLYRKNGFFPYSDSQGIFMAEIVEVENNGLLVLKTDIGEVRRYAFKQLKIES